MHQRQETERVRGSMNTGVIARIGRATRLALAGLCAVVGVIGLLLPVIPGILLLGLAAWLAGHGTGAQPSSLRYQGLRPGQRLRLRLLLVARYMLDSLTRRLPGRRQFPADE